MPYTPKQAKNKAKGIVKVQISMQKMKFDDGTEGDYRVLIYNQDKSVNHVQTLTLGIQDAMGMRLKAYFYYRMNRVGLFKMGKEIELLHEAPTQEW
jgi:hypothetical protein